MTERRSSMKKEGSTVSKDKKKKRGVYWGDLVIYEFPNILGDNPATSDGGAPLSIGWKHQQKNVVAVDYYEFLRQSHPRRKRKDLVISGGARDT